MIKQSCKYLVRVLTNRPVIIHENFVEFSMTKKEDKYQKENIMEVFKIAFLLYAGVTLTISVTSCYVCVIV